MATNKWISFLLLIPLFGCGGGEVGIGIGVNAESAPDPQPFIAWTGNSSGDQVVDANNDTFAFYADTGCLYNFRTDLENAQFCLNTPQGTVRYGALAMRIVNALSTNGACISVLVEQSTANFVDIEVDPYGREVVAITSVRPAPCA
ncbi:hypothetical protein RY831_12990 [Noviherbaspirillum sp. CPCC 100848]|uniref:Lipoprotein n=1 Tax=Noviherbaspirillum album TaxID=3080276 RepID=A0ABU6J9Y5_9BURK|nr:hypothetical protein [Noviherbaspirillum sp. CPCC 100848]MEC4720072.1 hypothetical protein [Noviherbaspirillum sp. CPCC 100848]